MTDIPFATPIIMARIQSLQDRFSHDFQANLCICDKDFNDITIPSSYQELCRTALERSPAVCERFCQTVKEQMQRSESPIFSCCPFDVGYTLVPLGRFAADATRTECEYFLTIQQVADEADEWKRKARLIQSTFETIFSILKESQSASGSFQDSPSLRSIQNYENLTAREKEVARLVGLGLSNQELAAQLFISEHTVKIHIGNILRKTGLKNRTQLAIYEIMNK